MQDARQLTINAIRVLSAEAIQKANSGHPGLPLGAAPIGYAAFTNMVFNPKNTSFDNRDRFILSAGHGSMLAYSLYHLFGFKTALPLWEHGFNLWLGKFHMPHGTTRKH